MDDDSVNKLIELVKQNPAIYDRNSVRYKNSAYKAILWQNIASTLGQAEGEILTRWKSLRDRFCREHRKMTDPNVTAPRFEWAYYQDLLFLKDHTMHRTKLSNIQIKQEIKSKKEKSQSPLRMLQVDVLSVKDKEIYELEEETAEYNLNEYSNILDNESESSRQSLSSETFHEIPNKKRKTADHNYNHSPSNNHNMDVENEIGTGILKTINTFEKAFNQKTATELTPQSSKDQFFEEVRVFVNGFSETEQSKVQNRIMMYLCKCKIEVLSNGNIDKVQI